MDMVYLNDTSYRFSVAVIVLKIVPGPVTPSTSSAATGEVPLAHLVWYKTGTCGRHSNSHNARDKAWVNHVANQIPPFRFASEDGQTVQYVRLNKSD